MGVALWIACGVLAALLARIIPFRRGRIAAEIVVGLLAAAVGGLVATALDFGGWNELDWRAAVFAFFVALAAVGALRALLQPS